MRVDETGNDRGPVGVDSPVRMGAQTLSDLLEHPVRHQIESAVTERVVENPGDQGPYVLDQSRKSCSRLPCGMNFNGRSDEPNTETGEIQTPKSPAGLRKSGWLDLERKAKDVVQFLYDPQLPGPAKQIRPIKVSPGFVGRLGRVIEVRSRRNFELHQDQVFRGGKPQEMPCKGLPAAAAQDVAIMGVAGAEKVDVQILDATANHHTAQERVQVQELGLRPEAVCGTEADQPVELRPAASYQQVNVERRPLDTPHVSGKAADDSIGKRELTKEILQ